MTSVPAIFYVYPKMLNCNRSGFSLFGDVLYQKIPEWMLVCSFRRLYISLYFDVFSFCPAFIKNSGFEFLCTHGWPNKLGGRVVHF